MSSPTRNPNADDPLSRLTGEFVDPALERRYAREHWGGQARQIRVVLFISILAYGLASYQNYLDLQAGTPLLAIGISRLAQLILFAWGILLSYRAGPAAGMPLVLFAGEVVTGVSEAVEMLAYHESGFTINLISAPFFAFIILIFYIFLRIPWALTTTASLLGSGCVVAGYAYIAAGHPESIIRHPVVLLGVIALGAGALRVMNRLHRHDWQQGKVLEVEVAERRRAEQRALEASRAKGEFLAVMSHEIRTPLNSILAMTEMLSDERVLRDERSRHQLEVLATAGRHLNELVDDILDFSRIEANATTIAREPFDLPSTIRRAGATVQNLATRKGLDLRIAVDPDLPPYFVGDPQRIRQVLINLMGNAIKFTDAGRIEVQAGGSAQAPAVVRFSVSDTGIGIPEEDLARIFEPFQQSDSSSTRQYQGTGLGLAISRNLVERMGGHIEAHNRAEGGAVFAFELPLAPTDEAPAPGADTRRERPARAPAAPFKALVVEDSALNRMVIEEYLADVACELRFAHTGGEGVAAFQGETFDIVLMDQQMPEMDGITATRLIRDWERAAGRAPSPIVIVTADGLGETRQRALDAGVSDYLTKPMSQADLFDTLNRYVQADIARDAVDATLAPLLPRFFEQMRQDVAAMAQTLDDDDTGALAALAHAAKGHGQMFGFARIADTAARLETAAKASPAITPALRESWRALHDATVAAERDRERASPVPADTGIG